MKDLSYYHSISKKPLVNLTYWNILDKNCAKHPEKDAVIIYQDDTCVFRAKFKQLRDYTKTNAAIFIHRLPEMNFGDRIAIVGSNMPEVVLAELMAYRLGMCAVFPPSILTSAADLIKALNLTRCKILIFQADFISKEEINLILSKSCVNFCISFGDAAFEDHTRKVWHWNNFFKSEIATDEDKIKTESMFQKLQPDMEASVYFTSGSTGEPKAIIHSHFLIVNNQLVSGELYKWSPHTIFCQNRPISVPVGAFFSTRLACICGGTSIIVNNTKAINRYDTSSIIAGIVESEKVNQTLLFGYMIQDFISAPLSIRDKIKSLEIVTVTGQVPNTKHIELFKEYFPSLRLCQMYGSTEMNAVLIQDETTNPAFLGKPLHHIEAKIVNENGKSVPLGSHGELYLRTPMTFLAYITKDGLKTGKDAAGWFHTDDAAIMNAKGEIKIIGRISDVIKRAGQLIFPVVIENVIGEHPLVQGVQVIGVSDVRLNQDICACVVPAEPKLSEDELRSWCKNVFKSATHGSIEPKYFIFLKQFPLSGTNKINRGLLKALAEETIHGDA